MCVTLSAMNTYSHMLINAVLKKPIQRNQSRIGSFMSKLPELKFGWFVFGGLMPDLPLILITFGTIIYDQFVLKVPMPSPDNMEEGAQIVSTTGRLFRDWFFNEPWVIAPHQAFHSPLLLTVYLLIAYWLWKRGNRKVSWFFWLAAGSMLHTLADIPVHVDDGPLLLFPLNWEWRYISPLSYWDRNYYGAQWTIFEHALDLVLIAGLIVNRVRNKRQQA